MNKTKFRKINKRNRTKKHKNIGGRREYIGKYPNAITNYTFLHVSQLPNTNPNFKFVGTLIGEIQMEELEYKNQFYSKDYDKIHEFIENVVSGIVSDLNKSMENNPNNPNKVVYTKNQVQIHDFKPNFQNIINVVSGEEFYTCYVFITGSIYVESLEKLNSDLNEKLLGSVKGNQDMVTEIQNKI